MRRNGRIMIAGVALGGALTLVGCEAASEARGTNSILALSQPVSPAEAADMALDEYNADARARGIVLLANAYFGNEPPYMELYRDAVDDPDPAVRAAAARALSIHGTPEDVPFLMDLLSPDTEESEAVRLEAARTLQRIYNPEAVPTLLNATRRPDPLATTELVAEESPEVRAEAAIALGQYAEPRVVERLISTLDDRHLAVNSAARRSLKTLTGQDYGFDRRAWVHWYDQAEDPFAGRSEYQYPVFERDEKLIEVLLPFLPGPPNEPQARPAGMPPTPTPAPSE